MKSNPDFFRTTALKVGANRGQPRIWIEGRWLEQAGFVPDARIEADAESGTITLRLEPAGSRKVSATGKRRVPVIDLNSAELQEALGRAERVKVVARAGEIVITPERTERKRSARTRNRREGSLFAGGGLLSQAARQAGYTPAFAVEWEPRYADVFARNHPEARVFNQSMSEVNLEALPEVELLTMGIPCEPYSRNRTVNRGTGSKRDRSLPPEAHDLGDMVFWALRVVDHLNPATVVVEEAPGFLAAGAGWVMRHALHRMGYHVDAGVFDPRDYGALTGRRRAALIARTNGPVRWPTPRPRTRTLAEVLNPVDHPDNEWFDFNRGEKLWLQRHWERQTARGNGFASQIVDASDTSIGTITRRYFAGQGDNPVVRHPTRRDTYRWLTLAEVRRLHDLPDHYDLGRAKTLAGEIIGQGVVVGFFRQLIEAASEPITTRARRAA